jgi:hypothetical protein
MLNILNDFNTGEILITNEWDISATMSNDPFITPQLNSIGEEYTISVIQLERVEKFISFEYESLGSTQNRFLETFYRISRNSTSWSEWLPLEEEINNFPPFDPLDKMWIDIKFVRSGTKSDGSIRLVKFKLNGKLLRDENDGTIILNSGGESIIKPPFTYKVFRIDDFEVISTADALKYEIKYRFSQDNQRSWTEWEPLTKENISTVRINPVRFFHIEYLVKNISDSTIKIQDINLIGDFQNVTQDYQKTNLFGIRECCQSNLLGTFDENGNFIPATNGSGGLSGEACSTGGPNWTPMSVAEKANLFNPYAQQQTQQLLNKLSNDAMEIFGHRVQYFVTDPDSKGIDYSIHEYGLFNIVCEGQLKVAVDNNEFPDNQMVMNQFDLNLFDSFTIHITKENFKTLFGAHRRPSKEDLIYFCDINRLFIVDHAQQFRQFNNYAVYYKVILKKYNKSANVQPNTKSIEDRIKQLTKNSTVDELFGIENVEDKRSIANKPQLQPLTRDPIRVLIQGISTNSLIIKDLIQNSTTVISKQHYDFSEALIGGISNQVTAVIRYKNIDPVLRVSDNIGFTLWFNINNYIDNENYNFFNYFDDTNNLGWRLDLNADIIKLKLNSDEYDFSVDGLLEGVWYCLVLNIDQRNRNIKQWVYSRDVDPDDEDEARFLPSTKLRKIHFNELEMAPVEFELESVDAEILISDIKLTNIRLFNNIITESEHNKILNQYIIADDSKYLIFADNANMKLTLPNFPYNGSGFEKI